jgi:hypothetical protein
VKWNIWFTIRGPAATIPDIPNNTNPAECANLASLLTQLAQNLPNNPSLGVEVIGVRVEMAPEAFQRDTQ